MARFWDGDGAEVAAIHGTYAAALGPADGDIVTGGRWGTVWRWEVERPTRRRPFR